MRNVLLLLATLPLLAQPTISGLDVVQGTDFGSPRTSAKIIFQTSVASTNAKVQWGLAPGSNTYTVTPTSVLRTVHYVILTGLPPVVTIYYRACATASSLEGCSSESSFTASTVTSVQDPIAPNEYDPTPPATIGTPLVVGADCDDPSTGLVRRFTDATYASQNTIEIPVTTLCAGRYTFPSKSGWSAGRGIIIRSANYASLPPAGTRVTEADAANMPEIRHVSPILKERAGTTGLSCFAGRHFWNTSEADAFKLWRCELQAVAPAITGITQADLAVVTFASAHGLSNGDYIYIKDVLGTTQANGNYCVSDATSTTVTLRLITNCSTGIPGNGAYISGGTAQKHVWAKAPVTSGTTLPGTCTVGNWFYLTTAATAKEGAYWCVSTNTLQRVLLDNQDGSGAYNNGAVLDFAGAGPTYIYLIGLRLTTTTIPGSDMWHGYLPNITTAAMSDSGGPASPTYFTTMISGTKGLHLDRCLAIPHRLSRVENLFTVPRQGAPFSLTNSIVGTQDAPFALWRGAGLGITPTEGATIVSVDGNIGSGMTIKNNYLAGIGTGAVFIQDGASSAVKLSNLTQDVVIEGNDMEWPIPFNCLISGAGQRCATGRHHIEIKGGRRYRIRGNRITNTWVGPNRGEAIALANRLGDSGFTGELTCTSGVCSCTYNYLYAHCDNRTIGEKLSFNGNIYTITASGSNSLTVTPPVTGSFNDMYSLWRAPLTDVDIQDNVVSNVSGGYYTIGVENAGDLKGSGALTRTRFRNNIFMPKRNSFGMCIRSTSNSCNNIAFLPTTFAACNIGTPPDQDCWGGGAILQGTDDFQTINDAFFSVGYEPQRKYSQGASIGTFAGGTVESGNVFFGNTISGVTQVWHDFSTSGLTMINNYHPTGLYSITGNILASSSALTGTQPPGNTAYRVDVSGTFPRASDFNRIVGAYGAYGAEISSINTARGLTQNIRVDTATAGSVTVGWYAPTTAACTLQIGATRVTASGGSRSQSATISGLSQGAATATVMCARQDAVGVRVN